MIKLGETYQCLPIEKNIYSILHDNMDKVNQGKISLANLSRLIHENLEKEGFV